MVYFTIHPVHPINTKGRNLKILKSGMMQFKDYLDSKGSDLSSSQEFLKFYALPYMNDPQVDLAIIQ